MYLYTYSPSRRPHVAWHNMIRRIPREKGSNGWYFLKKDPLLRIAVQLYQYLLPLQSGLRYTQLIVWPVQEDAATVFTRVVDKILYARKVMTQSSRNSLKEILIQVRIVRTKNLSSPLPSFPFHKTFFRVLSLILRMQLNLLDKLFKSNSHLLYAYVRWEGIESHSCII